MPFCLNCGFRVALREFAPITTAVQLVSMAAKRGD